MRVPASAEQVARLREEAAASRGPAVKRIGAEQIASEPPPKKRKANGDHSAAVQKNYERALALISEVKQGEQRAVMQIGPEVLVGLYAALHERVYEVLPLELSQDWLAAVSAARKMLRDEFGDDPIAMAEYLRWSFAREKKRERVNRASKALNGTGWRVGWRYAFAKRAMLTDYLREMKRLEKARK